MKKLSVMTASFFALSLVFVGVALAYTHYLANPDQHSVQNPGSNPLIEYKIDSSAYSYISSLRTAANNYNYVGADLHYVEEYGVPGGKTVIITATNNLDGICGVSATAGCYQHKTNGEPDRIYVGVQEMNALTEDRRINVIAHEFGHAANLKDHNCTETKEVSIMRTGPRTADCVIPSVVPQGPQAHDKVDLEARW